MRHGLQFGRFERRHSEPSGSATDLLRHLHGRLQTGRLEGCSHRLEKRLGAVHLFGHSGLVAGRTLLLAGSDLYAAGNLLTGGTQQVGQIWLNGDAYETLTDGTTPGDVRGLFLAGGTLYAAGSKGEEAVVWKNGKLLYTLTDGSSSAEAMSLWMTDGELYTVGYYTKPDFEEQGVVWKNGTQLYTLSDGTSSGSMPYAVAAWGDDLFTAGTLFGSSRHAAVWKGSDLLYTLGRGEAYAMYVVPHYESDETTGAEDSGDTSGNN